MQYRNEPNDYIYTIYTYVVVGDVYYYYYYLLGIVSPGKDVFAFVSEFRWHIRERPSDVRTRAPRVLMPKPVFYNSISSRCEKTYLPDIKYYTKRFYYFCSTEDSCSRIITSRIKRLSDIIIIHTLYYYLWLQFTCI